MSKSESESCYSCGKKNPEYQLDDRPLCGECYQREKKLVLAE